MSGTRRQPSGKQELDQTEDVELIGRVLAGEQAAYEVLMDRYSSLVVGFLYGRTRCESDAEDLAQEILLKAHANLAKLRDRRRFGPWLMRIARSRLHDYYRAVQRQPRLLPGEDDLLAEQSLTQAREPSPDPSRKAQLTEVKQLVFNAIAQMDEKYRVVLYLRLVDEESPAAIAQRLGTRENTIRLRIYRALKLLRKALKKQGIGPESME